MSTIKIRMAGDPPGAGEAKLRIESNGDPLRLDVFVVDAAGKKLRLLGVAGLTFGWRIGAHGPEQEATVKIIDSEIDAELADARIEPVKE